jgi:hypothetical protein
MISRDSNVYIAAPYGGDLFWLIKAENKRNPQNQLILQGEWTKESRDARPVSLELALVYRRRFMEECRQPVHFALERGSRQFVEEETGASIGEDTRQPVPVVYKGYRILARPGINVTNGERVWFVHIHDGRMQLDSVRGSSPEEVVMKVFERGQEKFAQRAPEDPVQQQVQQQQRPAGPRVRPGDLKGRK